MGKPVGYPDAKAGFGSLRPIIEQAFKNLLQKPPVQVTAVKRST